MCLPLINPLQQHKDLALFFATLLTHIFLPLNAWCQDHQDKELMAIPVHELFAEIGRRVPAFGGMFVGEDKDTLYAYMVPWQAGDAPAVDKAITDVLGYRRPPQHRL